MTLSYINPTFPFFSSIFGMLKPRCQRRPCPRRQRSTGPTWTPPPVVMAFRWPRCHITIFPNSCTMLRKWWVSPRKNWGKTGSMKNGVLTTFHPKIPKKIKGCQRQNDGFLPWCRWNPFGTTSSWQLRSREVTGPA